MAQAMLRLLARPKMTAVFCESLMRFISLTQRSNFLCYSKLAQVLKLRSLGPQADLRMTTFKTKQAQQLNSMKGAFNFFYGIAQDDGPAVRAAHGAISFCERVEQPFHFCVIERHVHLNGGVASGGRGDFRLKRFDGDGGVFAVDAVENFGEKFFGVGCLDASRHGLNSDAARAHGLNFETVGRQFFCDFLEDDDLARREFEDKRHEHALRFNFAGAACSEVLFEEDAFVRDVLVDDPQAFAVDGDDEAGADLTEWF